MLGGRLTRLGAMKSPLLLVLLWLAQATSMGAPAGAGHVDHTNQFRIAQPRGWGAAPLAGRIVWHVASNGGTEQPDCGVIVSQDWSFAATGVDGYIRGQSREGVKEMLSMNFTDVVIGHWEPNFTLAGQRALHQIYTGTIDGRRQTTMNIQTVRGNKLYTFFCNAPADKFPLIYLDLLKVSDTFAFTGKRP